MGLLEMVSTSPIQVGVALLGEVLPFRSAQPHAIEYRLLLRRRSDIHWQVIILERNLGEILLETNEINAYRTDRI